MPTALNVKPEEIDSAEKRSSFLVGVVGCGQKGIFFASLLPMQVSRLHVWMLTPA